MYESSNLQRSTCNCNESRCPAKADTGPQHTAFRSPAPKGLPRLGPHKSKSLRHEPFGKDTPSFGDQCRIYPKTHHPWEKLAAIPETYFTAWGSLFQGLKPHPDDTLLIRGATCALGHAAIQIAKALGCKVIATTHRESKLQLLSQADLALLDTGSLENIFSGEIAGAVQTGRTSQISGAAKTDGTAVPRPSKALELVGPKTLADTLRCVGKGGIVCTTGILGGVYAINGFDPIKYIPNGVFLTGFYSNSPSQDIMDEIFCFMNAEHLTPPVGKVFDFSDIRKACTAQDNGSIDGKIIVRVSD